MADAPATTLPLLGEELPATFANFFHVNVQSDLTRIVFAEQNPNSRNTYARSAFVVTTENARLLAELINRLIAEHKAKGG